MAMKVRSKIKRFSIALGVGLVAGVGMYIVTQKWELVPLAAWDALVLTLLILFVRDFHGHSPSETKQLARQDNLGRSMTDIILLVASLASIGAVIQLLASSDRSVLHIAFALGSIVLSWAMVHAVYMLRYAVIYYDNREYGIDFSSKQ